MTEGFVYMIQESVNGTATGYYKVGRAVESNLNKRLSDLRTGNPRYLSFRDTVLTTDYVAAESKAQQAIVSYKSNLGGGSEWYKADSSQFAAFKQAFDTALAPFVKPGAVLRQIEEAVRLLGGSEAAQEGYVYMIRESASGVATDQYKVGKALASSVDQRLRNLQTGNPRLLGFKERVLTTDYTAAEKEAQKAVATYKSTLGGGSEWYAATAGQFSAFEKAFNDALKPYIK